MFFTPTTLKSASIERLNIDPANNTVVVKFINNVRSYIYQNVDFNAIVKYMMGDSSAGQFVNTIKQGDKVTFATFW